MKARKGDWIQTYTGRAFWPIDPRPEEICIDDVAHALSNQCRFAGHCRTFYSVAQHSVIVAECARSDDDPLWGLLHDASEAYLSDVTRPIKETSAMQEYREIEERLMRAICLRFNLSWPEPAWVKAADDAVLATEQRDLMKAPPIPWRLNAAPCPYQIFPWDPQVAEAAFLRAYDRIRSDSW